MDDLLGELERQVLLDELYALDDSLLKIVEEYTRRELPAVVRALSSGGKDEVGLMARLVLVVGYPPATAQHFLDWYGFDDATEAEVALQDIVRLYEDLKNRSYVGGRHILKLNRHDYRRHSGAIMSGTRRRYEWKAVHRGIQDRSGQAGGGAWSPGERSRDTPGGEPPMEVMTR